MKKHDRIKWIFFVFLTAIIFTSLTCNSNQEKNSPQQASEDKIEKVDTMQSIQEEGIDEEVEPKSFLEKNKDLFVESRIDSFWVPDYDMLDKYELTKIGDSNLVVEICESANVDWYDAKPYYFSIENRLNNLQDFTVFVMNNYSYNIVYCVMDVEDNLISALTVAYQFGEGEYSEYASGKFTDDLKYHLYILGVADAFEDVDGLIEGSEEESEKVFVIDEAGMVEEIDGI